MIFFKFLVLSLCFGATSLAAQLNGDFLIDSLTSELPKMKNDSNAVKLLAQLAFKVGFNDFNLGIMYSKKALERAEKLNWKDGIAFASNSLGIMYSNAGKFDEAVNSFNLARKNAEEAANMSEIAKSIGNLGLLYLNNGNYSRAYSYTIQSLDINKKIKDSHGIARDYSNLGLIYSRQAHYFLASEAFGKALAISIKIKDNASQAANYNNLGIIKSYQEKYNAALDYFFKSLAINKQLANDYMTSMNLANIGQMYSSLKEYGKALSFFNQSNEINKKIGNQLAIATNRINIADVKNKLKSFDDAIDLGKSAVSLLDTSAAKRELAYAFVTIAESFIGKALSDDDVVISHSDLDSALYFARVAEDYIDQINLKEDVYAVYDLIHRIYKAKGNFQKSLAYYEKYIEIKDSILSGEVQTKIANLEALRENQYKDAQIKILKNTEKLNKSQIQTIVISSAIILAVLLVFTIILAKRFRREKKLFAIVKDQKATLQTTNDNLESMNSKISSQNLKLEELNNQLVLRNEEINEQKEELIALNAKLNDINNTKDRFFSIIAHDLKSPIAAIYQNLDMLNLYFDKHEPDQIKENIVKQFAVAKNINELLDNLLHWAGTQTGRINFQPERIYLNQAIESNINLAGLAIDAKDIIINFKSSQQFYINCDMNMINSVIRNLVSNAIKFSYQGGSIDIRLEDFEGNMVLASFQDRGVGIRQEDHDKIFRVDSGFSTLGTKKEKGTGLGLVLCKEFIEKNGGNIWFESNPSEGSRFAFILPRE